MSGITFTRYAQNRKMDSHIPRWQNKLCLPINDRCTDPIRNIPLVQYFVIDPFLMLTVLRRLGKLSYGLLMDAWDTFSQSSCKIMLLGWLYSESYKVVLLQYSWTVAKYFQFSGVYQWNVWQLQPTDGHLIHLHVCIFQSSCVHQQSLMCQHRNILLISTPSPSKYFSNQCWRNHETPASTFRQISSILLIALSRLRNYHHFIRKDYPFLIIINSFQIPSNAPH